ncbi:MAG: hypothetical protein ACOZNI_08165 [Myxococcota bacterium]
MLASLPAWVTSNEASVRREAEAYREMTVEEHARLRAAACAMAARQIALRADAARVLAWEDPLPASSIEALRRLRAGHWPRR